jgi:hypothetical protein
MPSLLVGLHDAFLFNTGGVTSTSAVQSYVLTNQAALSSPTATGPAGGADLARTQNATSSYLDGGIVNTFQVISSPTAQWAFEFYIALDAAQEAAGAINFYGPRNNTSGITYGMLDWNPGAGERRIRLRGVDNSDVGTYVIPAVGSMLADGSWHHVLAWRDAANINLQLDGGTALNAACATTKNGTYQYMTAFSTPRCSISRYSVWTRAFTADERTFLNSAVKTYPWTS